MVLPYNKLPVPINVSLNPFPPHNTSLSLSSLGIFFLTVKSKISATLYLSSSLIARGRECGENFIKTKILLPAGKVKATCQVSARDDSWFSAHSSCIIDGNKVEVKANADQTITDTKIFEIDIREPREVDIIIISSGVEGANGDSDTSARLTLEFEEVDCFIDSDCGEDQLINRRCIGDDLTESFINNVCIYNQCVSDKKTITIDNCELGCGVVDTNTECIKSIPLLKNPTFLIIGAVIIIIAIGLIVFFIRRRQ